jgi:hypothetical protein
MDHLFRLHRDIDRLNRDILEPIQERAKVVRDNARWKIEWIAPLAPKPGVPAVLPAPA